MGMATYWTGRLSARCEDGVREVAALSARAARLGLGPLSLERRGENVVLTGPPLALETYTLRGLLDHRADPPALRTFPGPGGLIDADYWTAQPPRCDHCGLNRDRRHTAVISDQRTSQLQQVGTSCLRAATRHSDPVRVLRHGEYVAAAIALLEDQRPGDDRIETRSYLARVIELTRRDGFVSLADATAERPSTSEQALDSDQPADPAALRHADEVLRWSLEQRATWLPPLSDFAQRVIAAAAHPTIGVGEAHLVAHAHTQRQRDLAARRRHSRHQGTPGNALLLTATVQDSGATAHAWVTTLRDRAGNRYSIFTAHQPTWATLDATVHLDCVVERHAELRSGEKVTVLRAPRTVTPTDPARC